MALRETIKEQIYLKSLFNQIPILKNQYSNRLYIDSQSAIKLTKNPIYYNKSKYIDIQYYFIREAYLDNLFNLIYILIDK